MILVDTSAWVEFLRGTESPVCNRVEDLLVSEIAICDAIRMEVLAGARNEQHLQSLRRLLARAVTLPTRPSDYEDAALLYRSCRRGGETVRKLIDCLITAVALRYGIQILHDDRDFDTIARHSTLEVVTTSQR
ncbi:type II toxin-antitoxin system VapC family toxin [Candidatus Spongiisocius sp.]|uniref:type II toxin-antitoxin system VapC family toxin n=1 Tax=Candidatus Spongiisocius sp. TaxID=3101273 RepID=UPI003B5C46E5